MRILIINPILYTAETDTIPKVNSIKDTMIYTLCQGFAANGDEPVLAAASDYKPVQPEEYPFEIVWLDTACQKLCKPRCLPWMPGLYRYLKENRDKFDGVITSEVFSLCSLTAAWLMPEKTVVWHELAAHNRMLHMIPSKLWYYVAARLFFRRVTVAARSESAREFIRRFCPQVMEQTIDHGTDVHKITVSRNKKNRFVVVSQLIPRKRIDKTIGVFAEFVKQGGEAGGYMLDIIGEGESAQQLKQLCVRLGIASQVIFHGKLSHEELAPVMAAAKAMLVYTERDNNMVSIVESIAAGTPVVTTGVPFNAAYIRSQELGIVDDDWDKESLNRMCSQNGMYAANCIRYRDKLSAEYVAQQFTGIFKSSQERAESGY